MAYIQILDTGFLKTDHSDAGQLASSLRANDGSSVELRITSMSFSSKLNLDIKPDVGTFNETENNVGSIENPIIQIQGVLDKKDDTDTALIPELVMLSQTKGYKALFYPINRDNTANSESKNNNLVYRLCDGHYNTTEPAGDIDITLKDTGGSTSSGYDLCDVEHLHIHVRNVTFNESPTSNKINYTISCSITG